MNLKAAQLLAICPRLGASKASTYVGPLWTAMQAENIVTPQRAAAFLAQTAHESGEFRWLQELWGPTPQQLKYDRPMLADGLAPHVLPNSGFVVPLWQRLGNDTPGDGFRFRGRSPIMLTGRGGYRKAEKALGIPLLDDPHLAAEPEHGFRIATWWWKENGCSTLADKGDFEALTRRINGGTIGLESRRAYHRKALTVLSV
jgi:putative chitinase